MNFDKEIGKYGLKSTYITGGTGNGNKQKKDN